MEVRDEKRLHALQKQLTNVKLLIVDELGYVPFTAIGAELLFEIFSGAMPLCTWRHAHDIELAV